MTEAIVLGSSIVVATCILAVALSGIRDELNAIRWALISHRHAIERLRDPDDKA